MSTRANYFLGLISVIVLLLISLYLQFYDGFVPCPLCSLQRLAFVLMGVLFFIGILLHAKRWGRNSINILATLTSFFGIIFAGRQIWLQHFPPANADECGVSLHYMLQVLPVNEVINKIFAGSAECTKRGWDFLHLNMAEWSLVWFILFFILCIYLMLREFLQRKN